MASAEIEKCVKKANISFLKDFLDAAVKCGELTEIGKERLKENKDLKDFFDEGRDELVETLQDKAKELSSLKARIKGDGLEYLLEDPLTDENWEKDNFQELLENAEGDFIQLSTFRGKKDGYTFKTDSQGTGYYKIGATFEESSEEEDLVECKGCSRVWAWYAQCPCGMNEHIFEGRTTFPSEPTEKTIQFILRYIEKEWGEVKYKGFKGPLGHVSYRIFKVDTSAKGWEGAYTLSISKRSLESLGTIDGKDSLGEEFSLDLLGKHFEELDNVLCILQDGVEDTNTFEERTTFPTELTDATNQFILRYISKKWQGLTYRKLNYGDEVAYSITKRSSEDAAPTHAPEYTLNGKGSCGIMSMDSDWGRDGFILDLKGEEFKVINNFLEDLMNM